MKRFFTLLIVCLCLMGIASCNATSVGSGGDIVIASKNFTEQDILGELLAQQIEATTELKVDRLRQLGSTSICHSAMLAGKVDAYVEYTGTMLTAILKQKVISDPTKVYNLVKQAYEKQFNLEVTKPLGFENTFAMIIRGEDAKKYNIKTLSEAAKYTPSWRAGFSYEFVEREDGFPGLSKAYNLKFCIHNSK